MSWYPRTHFETIELYVYDAANRMVKGVNEVGEAVVQWLQFDAENSPQVYAEE